MIIRSLTTTALRHLEDQTFQFDPHFNLIVGGNASGKTTLLEAIHLLSHLRSFRTNQLNQLIHYDADAFRLFAKVSDGVTESQIGIERNRQQLVVRKDFEDVRRRSLLAKLLPVLFLGPDSGQLLNESPRFRRQYLDWGLFQIEPTYHHLWMRYDRALKQRNAALKQGMNERVLAGIEQELAEAGEAVNSFRGQLVESLNPWVNHYLHQFLAKRGDWQLEYRAGFSEATLAESLATHRSQDQQRGYTRVGPHRGDFHLKEGARLMGQYLSRGELKLATIALMLAQIALYREKSEQATILLMDDLTAELDYHHRQLLVETLMAQKTQLFLTCLEAKEFPEWADLGGDRPAFYYELSDGKAHKMV